MTAYAPRESQQARALRLNRLALELVRKHAPATTAGALPFRIVVNELIGGGADENEAIGAVYHALREYVAEREKQRKLERLRAK